MRLPLSILRKPAQKKRRQGRFALERLEDRLAMAIDLALETPTVPVAGAVGQPVEVSWYTRNTGDDPTAGIWYENIYFSQDDTLSEDDVVIAGGLWDNATLLPGEALYRAQTTAAIPSAPAGQGYILFFIDALGDMPETDEGNNFAAMPISLTAPDVEITSVTAPTSAIGRETIQVSWTVTNNGDATAENYWFDSVYLSDDDTFDASDIQLGSFYNGAGTSSEGGWIPPEKPPLAPGDSYVASQYITIQAHTSGSKYLLFVADEFGYQPESNDGNNVYASPIDVQLTDLAITGVSLPGVVTLGETHEISWTVHNNGPVNAVGYWADALYVSEDDVLDENDYLIDYYYLYDQDIAVDGEYTNTVNAFFSAIPLSGNAYLIFSVNDPAYSLAQSEEFIGNEVLAAPIQILVPNLTLTSATAPEAAAIGSPLDVEWTVENTSEIYAPGGWFDYVYISDDETLDGDDLFLTFVQRFVGEPLESGQSYTNSISEILPDVGLGQKYVIVTTNRDAFGLSVQGETDYTDNTIVLSVTVDAGDLAVTNFEVGDSVIADNEAVDLTYTVQNIGAATLSADLYDSIYLSDDDVYDGEDVLLATLGGETRTLANGESYTFNGPVSLNLPAETGTGAKYLIVVANSTSVIGEATRDNNAFAIPITLEAPDLKLVDATAPGQAALGQTIQVSWTVLNDSDIDAYDLQSDTVYLSDDDILDEYDLVAHAEWYGTETTVLAGGSYSITVNATIPGASAGYKYLLFATDSYPYYYNSYRTTGYQQETDEANNVLALSIQVFGADLIVTDAIGPTEFVDNQDFQADFTVKNQGPGDAIGSYFDGIYLSTDPFYDETDTFLQVVYHLDGQVLSGESYDTSTQTVFDATYSGPAYILYIADVFNQIPEIDEGNNVYAVPITIGASDLTITDATAPAVATLGHTITVDATVENLGDGDAMGFWWDRVYYSSDQTLDASDVYLGGNQPQATVGSGSTYNIAIQASIEGIPAGSGYLIVKTDSLNLFGGVGTVLETDESNNTFVIPITIKQMDLAITDVSAPENVVSGSQVAVSWTVKNQGDGTGSRAWSDSVYLSNDNVFDVGDTSMGAFLSTSVLPLGPGESYTRNVNVTIPATSPGAKYLIVVTDRQFFNATGVFPESDETNNVLVVPINVAIPDVTVTDIDAPASGLVGSIINLSWTVENIGAVVAGADWSDNVYLSLDQTLDAGDTFLLSRIISAQTPLAAGADYTVGTSFVVPNLQPGPWYLLVSADHFGQQAESNENNNVLAIPFVVNVAPTAPAIVAPATGVRGEPLTFTLSANDTAADASAGFTFDIDWNGDDVYDETVVGPSGTQVTHIYSTAGSRNVKMRASDQHGASTGVISHNVSITNVALRANPDNPSLVDLAWGGDVDENRLFIHTRVDPTVVYVQHLDTGVVEVYAGVTGVVRVFGQGGDDWLVASLLERPAYLYGGEGDDFVVGGVSGDVLVGAEGNDFLIGGNQSTDGDDVLLGGAGRDGLIGHLGADVLEGGEDEDILLGGAARLFFLSPDEMQSVHDILTPWLDAADYADRVALMSAGIEDGVFLDDGAVDSVIGGAGDLDWFFLASSDVSDVELGETASALVPVLSSLDIVGPSQFLIGTEAQLTLVTANPSLPGDASFNFTLVAFPGQGTSVTQVSGPSGQTIIFTTPDPSGEDGVFVIVALAIDDNGIATQLRLRWFQAISPELV